MQVPASSIILELNDFNQDIYSLEVASGAVERITATAENTEGDPAWSPDGRMLGYARGGNLFGGPYEFVIATLDGEGVSITESARIQFAEWSPDSHEVAYLKGNFYAEDYFGCTDDRDLEIRILDVSTSTSRPLKLRGQAGCRLYGTPYWSPDGRTIAFAAGDLYLVDVPSGEMATVIDAPEKMRFTALAWSPDGSRLATIMRDDVSTEGQVMIASLDGSELKAVAPAGRGGWLGDVRWSSDGGTIAYIETDQDVQRLRIVDVGTGASRTIAEERPGSFAFSPDGSLIAYSVSDLQQAEHLRVAAVASGETRELLKEPTWIGRLSWSPDGTKLGFSSGRDSLWGLYALLPDGSFAALRQGIANQPQFKVLDGPKGRTLYSWPTNPYGNGSMVFASGGARFAVATHPLSVESYTRFCADSDLDNDVYVYYSGSGRGFNITHGAGANEPGPVAWSPDNQWLAFASGPPGCGKPLRLEVIRPDGSDRKLLAEVEPWDGPGGINRIVWAENGRSIYFAASKAVSRGSTSLYTVDIDGKNLGKLIDVPGMPVWAAQDGNHGFNAETGPALLAPADGAQGLGLIFIGNGLVEYRDEVAGWRVYDPMLWSPDGKRLAFVGCRDDPCFATLVTYDLETRLVTEVATRRLIDSFKWSADSSHVAFVSHMPPCASGEGIPPGKLEMANWDGTSLTTVIDRCIARSIIGWAP